MRRILLIVVLQGALVRSLTDVLGYFGDNVTLPSGADPLWTLSKIEWSIFSNNTWIATYRNGQENIERFYLYKQRLSLNTLSGDLTIHNLTTMDAMEYSVDLINDEGRDSGNKVKLTVKQRLQKPTIETVISPFPKGGCRVLLNCSSADEGVDFTWQVEPPSLDTLPMSARDSNSAVYLVSLNTPQKPAEFTCISSRKMENASSVITLKCDDGETQQKNVSSASSGLYFVASFIGFIAGWGLTLMYVFRAKIKAVLVDAKA
ncbi:CD48 antigen isoform X2 [Chaetodon auriga]|uniref:CD48 antigen isoform X2 n=1 Tax=Chaetodon auriga TaxID=39042 RepID=UPI004032A2A2